MFSEDIFQSSPSSATSTTTLPTTTSSSSPVSSSSATTTHYDQQQPSYLFTLVHSITLKFLTFISLYYHQKNSTSSSSATTTSTATATATTTGLLSNTGGTTLSTTTVNTNNTSQWIHQKSITCTKWIIWSVSKWIQIWAAFHIYYLMNQSTTSLHLLNTTNNNSGNEVDRAGLLQQVAMWFLGSSSSSSSSSSRGNMDDFIVSSGGTENDDPVINQLTTKVPLLNKSVVAFFILMGSAIGWLLMEHASVRQWIRRRFSSKHRDEAHSSSGSGEDVRDYMSGLSALRNTILSPFFLPKLLFHSSWITVSTMMWLYALHVFAYPRLFMMQYFEHCVAILLGSALGWKSTYRNMGQPVHVIMFVWALFLMFAQTATTTADSTSPTTWFETLALMGQRITFNDLMHKSYYFGLFTLSLIATVLRKNHVKKLQVDMKKIHFDQQLPIPGAAYWITIIAAAFMLVPWIVLCILINLRTSFQLISLFHILRTMLFGCCLLTVPYYTERLCHVSYSNTAASASQSNDNTQLLVPNLYWRMFWTFVMISVFYWRSSMAFTLASLMFLKIVYDLTINQNEKYVPFASFTMNGEGAPYKFLSGNAQKSGRLLSRIRNGTIVYLQFIMSNRDSRYLFIFLVANLLFMFVELFYGIWSNSLGLISDSAHMLFDCAALGIGLYGAYMSKWKRNQTYTYGYSRYEYLSGFVNGLLLVFISSYIFIEAFHRVFDPPTVDTNRLLIVSILGFLINLMGVVFFHDHGHSHDDENMHGVYLHMLADALGSVGVIISTIIMQYYGWFLADPLCSLMISVLILMASYPLLSNSVAVLLQRFPSHSEQKLCDTIHEIQHMSGVNEVYNTHFWTMSSGVHVGSIHVRVQNQVNEQELLTTLTNMFYSKCSITDITIQIEKDNVLPEHNIQNLQVNT